MRSPDAALTEKICRAVEARRDEIVRLSQGFVRVPLVTGDEGTMAEAAEEAFHGMELGVERFEATTKDVAPYLEHVVRRPGTKAARTSSDGGRARRGRSILLNAHIDTSRLRGTCGHGAYR